MLASAILSVQLLKAGHSALDFERHGHYESLAGQDERALPLATGVKKMIAEYEQKLVPTAVQPLPSRRPLRAQFKKPFVTNPAILGSQFNSILQVGSLVQRDQPVGAVNMSKIPVEQTAKKTSSLLLNRTQKHQVYNGGDQVNTMVEDNSTAESRKDICSNPSNSHVVNHANHPSDLHQMLSVFCKPSKNYAPRETLLFDEWNEKRLNDILSKGGLLPDLAFTGAAVSRLMARTELPDFIMEAFSRLNDAHAGPALGQNRTSGTFASVGPGQRDASAIKVVISSAELEGKTGIYTVNVVNDSLRPRSPDWRLMYGLLIALRKESMGPDGLLAKLPKPSAVAKFAFFAPRFTPELVYEFLNACSCGLERLEEVVREGEPLAVALCLSRGLVWCPPRSNSNYFFPKDPAEDNGFSLVALAASAMCSTKFDSLDVVQQMLPQLRRATCPSAGVRGQGWHAATVRSTDSSSTTQFLGARTVASWTRESLLRRMPSRQQGVLHVMRSCVSRAHDAR